MTLKALSKKTIKHIMFCFSFCETRGAKVNVNHLTKAWNIESKSQQLTGHRRKRGTNG